MNNKSFFSSNIQIDEVSENIWFNFGDLPSSPSRREMAICPSNSVIQLQNSPQTSFVENFTNKTRKLMAKMIFDVMCEQLGGGLHSN